VTFIAKACCIAATGLLAVGIAWTQEEPVCVENSPERRGEIGCSRQDVRVQHANLVRLRGRGQAHPGRVHRHVRRDAAIEVDLLHRAGGGEEEPEPTRRHGGGDRARAYSGGRDRSSARQRQAVGSGTLASSASSSVAATRGSVSR